MSVEIHPASAPIRPRSLFRLHERAPFSVPITIHRLRSGHICTTRGMSLDVSEGGLGAIVEGDLWVGEIVEVDMCVGGVAVSTVAVVRHASRVQSGFEFLGLTADERKSIATIAGA